MEKFKVNENIKYIITEKGKRPSAVADQAGIRRDIFSRILHNNRAVFAHEVQPIAWALGVPLEKLLEEG